MRGMQSTWSGKSNLGYQSCLRLRMQLVIKDHCINQLIQCLSGKIKTVYQVKYRRDSWTLTSTKAMIDQCDLICAQTVVKIASQRRTPALSQMQSLECQCWKVTKSPWWAARLTRWLTSWNSLTKKHKKKKKIRTRNGKWVVTTTNQSKQESQGSNRKKVSAKIEMLQRCKRPHSAKLKAICQKTKGQLSSKILRCRKSQRAQRKT